MSAARIRLGPLGITPSIALTNAGVDSNVFYEVENPRQDVTFTVSPQADTWFRAGPSRLATTIRSDLVYFHRYASERSVDWDARTRFEVPVNRVRPWVGASFAEGRQRVGYEIDLRTRRLVRGLSAGTDVRAAGSTRITLGAERTTTRYDEGAQFLGSNLADALDQQRDRVTAQYEQDLTPLTTFVVQASGARDAFSRSPERNAESLQVVAGFDLSRFALIAGQVRVGYQRFNPTTGQLSAYRGVVGNAGVSTVVGRVLVALDATRDLNYSFETIYPYYILTGATLTLTPRLTEHWDVQARAGLQRLAYDGRFAPVQDRVDRVDLLGGGVGYRIGREMRIGVNFYQERRRSPLLTRDYVAYRAGTTVTYGR